MGFYSFLSLELHPNIVFGGCVKLVRVDSTTLLRMWINFRLTSKIFWGFGLIQFTRSLITFFKCKRSLLYMGTLWRMLFLYYFSYISISWRFTRILNQVLLGTFIGVFGLGYHVLIKQLFLFIKYVSLYYSNLIVILSI